MSIKTYISRLLALVLVVVISLVGCSSSSGGLTGNYTEDTLKLIETLSTAIDLPADTENQSEIVALTRQQINDYASRYRRTSDTNSLSSFTTMQTAVNSLVGYYNSYGSRPLPEKLKARIQQEIKRVELALKRGN